MLNQDTFYHLISFGTSAARDVIFIGNARLGWQHLEKITPNSVPNLESLRMHIN